MVVFKFPKFLAEVRESGVGPEIQIRLFVYHDLNKLRTVLRYIFTLALLVLGADGVLENPIINLNPIAGSMLGTLIVFSLTSVMAISVILYLPRSSPSSSQQTVMVGALPARSDHRMSGIQLITLLKEGGQWDGLDDDLRDDRVVSDAPFADAEARGGSWTIGAEEKWAAKSQAEVPIVLGNFISPIGELSRPLEFVS